MNATVITGESGLRIWPTGSIVAYFQHAGTVRAAFDRPPLLPDLTPASIKVSDVYTDGRYRKTMTFRIPEASRSVCNRFLTLLKTYIVAVYTDARGVDRVMGSPRWPAYLSLERSGGSMKVTVEAWGDAPNPEFSLSRH